MKLKGVTADMAISTLEEMRKVPDKSVLLGMNTLSLVLASRRKEVCYIFRRTFTEMMLIPFLVQATRSTSENTQTNADMESGKKRRAPAIAARPKPKRPRASKSMQD